MEYSSVTYEVSYNLVMDVTEHSVTDTRVEECHGYHVFYDINSKYEIHSITIQIGDSVIDITDRLTDQEKELLTENQEL